MTDDIYGYSATGEGEPVIDPNHPLLNAKVKDRETGIWWGVARVYDGGDTNHDGIVLYRLGEERRVSSHIVDDWPRLYPPGHPGHKPDRWQEVVVR